MPAVAYKERPQDRPRERARERPQHQPQPRPQLKTFHARVIVTRAEDWWVEAHSAEEAEALLASGQGHHTALGERLHVELEELIDSAD
jgi:hypothetical protein